MEKIVLIIEDDEFLRSLASTKLRNENFSVEIADNGEQAIDKIENGTAPNIILLDLMLPNMSGYDVLKRIRENPKVSSVPVVVFSNLGNEEDIKKAMDIGANDFMIKSNFTLDELVERVKEMVK